MVSLPATQQQRVNITISNGVSAVSPSSARISVEIRSSLRLCAALLGDADDVAGQLAEDPEQLLGAAAAAAPVDPGDHGCRTSA